MSIVNYKLSIIIKSVLLYYSLAILSSQRKSEVQIMIMRYIGGHVQVYDIHGNFLYSADTEREAREEWEDYAESAA